MSVRESSRHSVQRQKFEKGNANEVPLGPRKQGNQRNTKQDKLIIIPHPKQEISNSKDTIGNSLRQMRNQVSNEPSVRTKETASASYNISPSEEKTLVKKKPSIKDRLGTKHAAGFDNNSHERKIYKEKAQFSGIGQRSGQTPIHQGRGYHGENASPYRGLRGRGGFRGRRGNFNCNQVPNIEGGFSTQYLDVGGAYPMPIDPNEGIKVRPRTARRAAAQLQSLFDSSLTFSSPKMMTSGSNGTSDPIISPTLTDSISKTINRRRYATNDCEECSICSNILFQVCHLHISTVKLIRSQQQLMLREQEKKMIEAKNLSIIETENKLWCPICRRQHHKEEMGSILIENCINIEMDDIDEEDRNLAPPGEEGMPSKLNWKEFGAPGQLIRRKLVMSSSALNNLWTTKLYSRSARFHVDFDCIHGGHIHDVHASFLYQYLGTKEPLNIVISCGDANIASGDTSWNIIFQLNSFVRSILQHSTDNQHEVANRILICPLLYAPKYCDNRLPPEENMLQKVIEVNRWIHKFNKENTGLQINLDSLGVIQIPNGLCGVQHDYAKWSESSWQDKANLTLDAKETLSQELLQVFETLEHQSYMLGRYREGRQSTGESNLAHNLRNDNIVPADNTIIADNVSNDKSKTNESVKPPGVDVEDDSDEDLSYLL